MKIFYLSLLLTSAMVFGQAIEVEPVPGSPNTASQSILASRLASDEALRCVPADKRYSHFGVIDEKTLMLANQDNDTLLAILRHSCPRLLDEGMVFILFRKGDGLSRVGSRMCAEDAFMMVRDDVVSVKNSDSQRACEFKAFHPLPLDEALTVIQSYGIVFKRMGVL